MLNADVIDLYSRVDVGTKIMVLPNYHNVAAFAPQMSHPGLWICAHPALPGASRSDMRT